MQFLASTWAVYGVDGDGDGRADRWDPADAIFGAARLPARAGAPGNYGRAIFAYNHASGTSTRSRVGTQLHAPRQRPEAARWPGKWAAGAGPPAGARDATPVRFIAGTSAVLDPDDGHVALIPAGVPAVVQAMLVAGNELQGLPTARSVIPIRWEPRRRTARARSTTSSTARGSGRSQKSSGTTRSPRPTSSGASLDPGRWVTIYATDAPNSARVHRHRRPPPRHLPRRDRHRSEPRPKRSSLADPAFDSHLGPLGGPPSPGL